MKRRLLWMPLALVVVVVAGGGFLWGHQVIAENLARSAYTNALGKVGRDIAHARKAGLFASELRGVVGKVSAIRSAKAPTDKTFWEANRESFYDKEAASLLTLDGSLQRKLTRATTAARSHIKALMAQFKEEVSEASADGLAAPVYVSAYNDGLLNLRSSKYVGQYRALAGQVQPKVAAFKELVAARAEDLTALLKQFDRSGHRLQAARSAVAARVSKARSRLSILEIFHRSPKLQRWLNHEANWATSRKTVHSLAIGASNLDSVNDAIKESIAKFMPSKWIYVSTENETISWYQNGSLIGTSLCTTGNPDLPTVTGHFTIIGKFSPFTFVSPDPVGSAYYYPPSPVSYAMEFQSAGYYIHDAPWRSAFGPGTDGPGQPGTNYGGTHGCVNVPFYVAEYLFGWAPLKTPVVVV